MRLPNHTTIAAYGALFLALGGTAAAATQLGRGSVTTREIKDRTVHVRDLATTARPPSRARIADTVTSILTDPNTGLNITVHGDKGDPGAPGPQGPAGPAGAPGSPGLAGYTLAEAVSPDVTPATTGGDTATCPAGKHALGGGARFTAQGQAGATIVRSEPAADGTGWIAAMNNAGPATGQVHVFAVCAEVTG